MTHHLDDQMLSDFADGALDTSARSAADEHIAQCDVCFARLQRLRALLAGASSLPSAIDPPAGEWSQVRARIADSKTRTLATSPWWTRRGALLAAGVALVMVSSAVTAVLVRGNGGVGAPSAAMVDTPQTLVPRLAALEHDYTTVTQDLERELAERKHALTPETIAAVERSLRTIDAAIAEAREALARDPSSETLARLFVASHDQKVELLRHAMRLAQS